MKKQRYKDRIERGLCTACGKNTSSVGKRCEHCKAKRKARLSELKAAGICQNCYKDPLKHGSTTLCEACYEKHLPTEEQKKERAVRQAKRRLLSVEKGLCRSCCKRLPIGGTYLEKGEFVSYVCCQICLDRQKTDENRKKDRENKRRLAAERIAKGLCVDCGIRPLVTKTFCQVCREEQLQPRKDRIKHGICSKCGKNKPSIGKMCESCKKDANEKYQSLKDEVYAKYGGYVCACCGETRKYFLTIDHANNDGSAMRKVHGTGPKMLSWLKVNNYPQDIGLQILCSNCQLGKVRNGGVCPCKLSNEMKSLLHIDPPLYTVKEAS